MKEYSLIGYKKHHIMVREGHDAPGIFFVEVTSKTKSVTFMFTGTYFSAITRAKQLINDMEDVRA